MADKPVLTEPLTKTALAGWWRLSRNTVEERCRRIEGAQRCGHRWMVPLHLMPFRYWIDAGLVDQRELARQIVLHSSAPQCTEHNDRASDFRDAA